MRFGRFLVFGLASNFVPLAGCGFNTIFWIFWCFSRISVRITVGRLDAGFTHDFWMEISLPYGVGATTWSFNSFGPFCDEIVVRPERRFGFRFLVEWWCARSVFSVNQGRWSFVSC